MDRYTDRDDMEVYVDVKSYTIAPITKTDVLLELMNDTMSMLKRVTNKQVNQKNMQGVR